MILDSNSWILPSLKALTRAEEAACFSFKIQAKWHNKKQPYQVTREF